MLQRETWFRCGKGQLACGLVIKGPSGTVQFWLSGFPEKSNRTYHRIFNITPVDLGYHALKPQHEGDKPMSDKCDILGVPCYYDGTSLGASKLFDAALAQDESVIWQRLEEVYFDRFGKETPDATAPASAL